MNLYFKYCAASFCAALSCLVFAGCGGGSDDNSSILFHGTLRDLHPQDQTPWGQLPQQGKGSSSSSEPGLADIQACALAQCDTTGEDGEFLFSVQTASFSGGDAAFLFIGADLNTRAVVHDIPAQPGEVDLLFYKDGELVFGSVVRGRSSSSQSSSSASTSGSNSQGFACQQCVETLVYSQEMTGETAIQSCTSGLEGLVAAGTCP